MFTLGDLLLSCCMYCCITCFFPAGACKEAIESQCQDVEQGDGQLADCLSQIAQAADFGDDAGVLAVQQPCKKSSSAGKKLCRTTALRDSSFAGQQPCRTAARVLSFAG
jgi:hypothetical protein